MDNHVLYRCWDATGQLLYVGLSDVPSKRIKDHEGGRNWWGLVTNITLEHYDSRKALCAAELTAIQTEHPRFNQANLTPPKRRRKPPHCRSVPAHLLDQVQDMERDDQIHYLHDQGYSYRDIESALGFSRGTIYNVLKYR